MLAGTTHALCMARTITEVSECASKFFYYVMLHMQVLCSTWKDDGTTIFSVSCDKQAKMWPLLTRGQPVTVAMHDETIKEIAWIPAMNLLTTGSCDKTLKYVYDGFL